MTQEKFDRTLCLLKGALNYESFRDVYVEIEAVIENVSLKQQLLADLAEEDLLIESSPANQGSKDVPSGCRQLIEDVGNIMV